ncbi:Helix-turn-helix domain-containing protein [Parafrankia irregularis]|uniref:Helix-turn-helix domain-containing protein n=1 Tax=Parafrankia irregularis TaxID=795642 RepID=A0A0S4QTN0_9ACTN|nr:MULTISPECIES: helix-turn-helix transcriptional regulator [Parafrankia]MBE3204537.1 helix-turn-helix domain-containing protein [Parafrankia sp. CH37]CUU58386.1 Helix-turn-helix domain-containing protein [Parafrankia irregularis]
MTDIGSGTSSAYDVDDHGARSSAVNIGRTLGSLRRARGLTGEALGAKVDMSQAKISKLERGLLRPTPADVERIARALDAPENAYRDLMDDAEKLQNAAARRGGRRRIGAVGQHDYFTEEGRARELRSYEPVAVPGLLQISEYTRRVVNGYFSLQYAEDASEQEWYADTAATVSLRAQRQERLYEPQRIFDFVMMESVLSNRFAPPAYMLAQIDRIEKVADLPNVTVRIVPRGVELRFPPAQGFTLLDDRAVMLESIEATIVRDRRTVDFYRRVHDYFVKNSETDLARMTDSYKTLYADLARPS